MAPSGRRTLALHFQFSPHEIQEGKGVDIVATSIAFNSLLMRFYHDEVGGGKSRADLSILSS